MGMGPLGLGPDIQTIHASITPALLLKSILPKIDTLFKIIFLICHKKVAKATEKMRIQRKGSRESAVGLDRRVQVGLVVSAIIK